MSEFMGLILGKYEAKEGGFLPGGATVSDKNKIYKSFTNFWTVASFNYDATWTRLQLFRTGFNFQTESTTRRWRNASFYVWIIFEYGHDQVGSIDMQ